MRDEHGRDEGQPEVELGVARASGKCERRLDEVLEAGRRSRRRPADRTVGQVGEAEHDGAELARMHERDRDDAWADSCGVPWPRYSPKNVSQMARVM